MFSNNPKHTGHLPTTKNYLIPNVNSPRLRETGTKRIILEVFILQHHWKGPNGPFKDLEWLGLPGRLSELTMQVATEDPNRTSSAQFCHFWQNANAWVRNVSGKVWSAGLVPVFDCLWFPSCALTKSLILGMPLWLETAFCFAWIFEPMISRTVSAILA